MVSFLFENESKERVPGMHETAHLSMSGHPDDYGGYASLVDLFIRFSKALSYQEETIKEFINVEKTEDSLYFL